MGDAKGHILDYLEYRRSAEERFAQLGIKLIFPFAVCLFPEGIPPDAVEHAPGLGNGGKNLVHDHLKILLDHAKTEIEHDDPITILVVPKLFSSAEDPEALARAVLPHRTDARDFEYTNLIVLSDHHIRSFGAIFTLPHEIGHVVTDALHYGADYSAGSPLHKIKHNLMRETGTSLVNQLTSSKRLYRGQAAMLVEDLMKKP